MSDSMSGMNQASEEVGEAAAHVLHSAGQLAGQSATLKQRVESFLAAVSAA
jgi:methyl-accepting chemotaxis protein